MIRVKCERLGRRLTLPEGYVVAVEGAGGSVVLPSDIVWREAGSGSAAGWSSASDGKGLSRAPAGAQISLLFCVARKASPEAPDFDSLKLGTAASQAIAPTVVTPAPVASSKRKKVKPAEVPTHTCPHCGAAKPVSGVWYEVVTGPDTSEMWCAACAESSSTHVCGREDCCTIVATDAAMLVSGSPWCPDCAEDHAQRCEHCGQMHPSDGFAQVTTGSNEGGFPVREEWCGACRSGNVSHCVHCGNDVVSDLTRLVDGRTWCRCCSDALARQCWDCGNFTANGRIDADSGEYFCRQCMPDRPSPTQRARNLVHGYHGFGGELNFYGGDASGSALFMGFELESGNTTQDKGLQAAEEVVALSDSQRRFHLERDGSIPDYGFELISAPMTLEEHTAFDWKRITSILIKYGLRSHDTGGRCGLHVHVSKRALPSSESAKIDMFIQRNKLFWEHAARRKESTYARFIDKGTSLSGYGKTVDGYGRYSALNFCHSGTVEFRLFRGTLRFETLMGTLELVDGVCTWIKTRTADQIVKNHAEVANFVKWMRAKPERYGRALAYLLKSKAYSEPGNPEV